MSPEMLEKEDAKYKIWILHLKLCRSDEETQNLTQTALENEARSMLRHLRYHRTTTTLFPRK